MMRWVKVAAGVALAVYVGFGAWLYATQDAQIFPRRVNAIAAPDHDQPAGLEYLSLKTSDGVTLQGLGFNTQALPTTLVLAFGGNAHDVTGMVRFLHHDVFPADDVAVVGYSYRGYSNALGRPSEGQPSEAALEADALAQYDVLVSWLQPARVVVVGYSLGTAVGTYLATQRKVDSLILAAPFASLVDVAQARYIIYPARLLVKHPFDTYKRLPQVTAPVTVVYSDTDGLIPPGELEVLKTAKPDAAFVPLVPPVKHGDVLDHPDIPAIFRQAAGFTGRE